MTRTEQLDQIAAALASGRVATVEETAAGLVHAARRAVDPHAEASRIVTGLWKTPDDHSRALLAAIESLRVEHVVIQALEAAVESAEDARLELDRASAGAGATMRAQVRELKETLAWFVAHPGWTTAPV